MSHQPQTLLPCWPPTCLVIRTLAPERRPSKSDAAERAGREEPRIITYCCCCFCCCWWIHLDVNLDPQPPAASPQTSKLLSLQTPSHKHTPDVQETPPPPPPPEEPPPSPETARPTNNDEQRRQRRCTADTPNANPDHTAGGSSSRRRSGPGGKGTGKRRRGIGR